MGADAANSLLQALRDSGLYGPAPLAAAERACAYLATDAPKFADELLKAGVLTTYQYRKVRGGHATELVFGPYLILDKLGEGGMGKVYRAVQARVGRAVALKVIRPHLIANKVAVSRYKREAKAAAALDHPNVVRLYDADDVNGRYFLAMEFIDGLDLARLVKEFGRPPEAGLADPAEACEYVRQAALGLQHAHERGLVHRDIKPSNLLVSGERALPGTSGKAVVKILDMGLVRSFQDANDASASELTRDGTVVGTPDYMSPEQAKNSSTVDGRADLYSLGCTLYFLLRGQPPFPTGSPIEKLIQHQTDAPPDVRAARPDVPEAVAAVVAKLLKKNPDERYQSASEVAAALAKALHPDDATRLTADAVHEPFSLAAGPDSIATIDPPKEATADTKPSLRLRVVTSGSGATTATTATSTAAPTAAVRPAVRLPAPRPETDSPIESPRVKSRRPTPPPPPRRRKPTRSEWSPLVVLAGAVTVLLAVVGIAVVVGGGRVPTVPTAAPTTRRAKTPDRPAVTAPPGQDAAAADAP